jgi:hypothetical protein
LKCPQIVNKVIERAKLTDWKELLFDQSIGLKSWTRVTDEGHKSLMAVFEVEGSIKEVLAIITNAKFRKIYDPAFDCGRYIE